MKKIVRLLTTGTACLLAATVHAGDNSIDYPVGYQGWYHVKSMLIQPGHALENPFQGIHHVYANDKARRGLESGNYDDGAVFTFDLLEYLEQDKTIQEGERKLLGVMKKDRRRFAETGGWGFEAFAGSSRTERLVGDEGESCFACHMSMKSSDYVFTKMR